MKALCLFVLAVVIACGDSNGPGPQAASVTGVAGDNQVAPTGAQFDFPLSLTALGSGGQPVQGVAVTWTVTPSGAVTFATPASSSDANGVVTTTVTAGPNPQNAVIQANVPGVTPVVYHALVVDPCNFALVHTVGSSINGALTTSDCNLSGYYTDLYTMTLAAQTGLTIDLSGNFDTWMDMYHDNGTSIQIIAFHDDIASPTNLNSRLQIIAAAGDYLLAPNTANQFVTGTYTLASATRSQALANCEQLWITRGVLVSDSITTTDCVSSGPTYSDRVRIIGLTGSVLTVAERSAALNALLTLNRVVFRQNLPDSLVLVVSNDDSAATTTNAFLSVTIAANAVYELNVGTSIAGQTGPYTLDVSSAATASAMRSQPLTSRDFWRGAALLPKRGKGARR